MTLISERRRASFYKYKSKNKLRNIYINIYKARQFSKIKTIHFTFLFTKSQTLYVMRFFMKSLKLAFI